MADVKKEQGGEVPGSAGDKVNGVDHRLLDGYDGGSSPPESFIESLLKGAPPEAQARAKAWAEDRAKLGDDRAQ